MSTEDKIAAIRREVEERHEAWYRQGNLADISEVVIYGVPLNEVEIEALRGLLWLSDRLHDKYKEAADVIWEMLERGKK